VKAGHRVSGLAAALAAEVHRLIGDARCSADAQCRTIAFGAKACGGPQAYLAWSTLVTDTATLEAAAGRHAAWRRAEIGRSGRASDCALVADPGASCLPAGASGDRACHLLSDTAGRGRNAR
jgi:hypothetical protein